MIASFSIGACGWVYNPPPRSLSMRKLKRFGLLANPNLLWMTGRQRFLSTPRTALQGPLRAEEIEPGLLCFAVSKMSQFEIAASL
jgi:hypothetical protein